MSDLDPAIPAEAHDIELKTSIPAGTPAPPLKSSTMVLFGMGAIADSTLSRSVASFLLIFYNQVVGLPATLVGGVIMVTLILDGFMNPIVGMITDNTRTRLGRRHPFLYAVAIPLGFMFCMLWNPPVGMSQFATGAYLIVALLMFRMCDVCYQVPCMALCPELTEDYDRRTRLISLRFFFGQAGALAITAVAYRVFLAKTPENPEGLLGRAGYGEFGIFAGILVTLAILTAAIATHTRIPWMHQPVVREIKVGVLLRELIGTLSAKSIWSVAGAGIFSATAISVGSALSLYFHIYFWELSSEQISFLVMASIPGAMLGVALVSLLAKRIDKKYAAIGLFVFLIASTTIPVMLRLAGLLPPNGSPFIFYLLVGEASVTFCAATMMGILITSMMLDLSEDAEIRTGRRSEGVILSIDDLLKKVTAGVGIFLSTSMLTLVGFPQEAKAGQVPLDALLGLGFTFILLVALFYGAALLCVLTYPITRKVHLQNLERIKQARPDTSTDA